MTPQSQGKIYLSQQRGLTQEGNDYRSYHTFNYGSFHHQDKDAIGNLLFLNEDTLNIGVDLKTFVQQGTVLLLLPLVGGLKYQGEDSGEASGEISGFVEAGQICLVNPAISTEIQISNPYKKELVCLLQIGLKVGLDQGKGDVGEFDLEAYPDRLLPLIFSVTEEAKYTLGSIGKFGGRESDSYQVKNPVAGVFVFVIDGVLEVQDRLLQSRDGLALWGEEEVEFEALTREAIILFIEMDTQPKAL